MNQPLAGRVALVTGASRGIGAATAVALAGLGAHVVLLARTQGGLEETDDTIKSAEGTGSILPLDLLEGEKIDLIGPSLHARFGRLDILVHAAGTLGKLTPVGHILPRDWADVVGVNLAATWRLIATADPLLRLSPAGRAVFLTDTPARAPAAYWGAYGATKAGMENLVLSWAEEIRSTPVRANLVHPGVIGTRLRANAFPGINPATWPKPDTIGSAIAALCLPDETRHGALITV